MRRWGRRTVVLAVVVVLGVALAGWHVYRRAGPRDAAAAGLHLRADVEILTTGLGLRQVTPDIMSDLGPAGEPCGVSDGLGRPVSEGPHRQHRIALDAAPPPGRRVTELGDDAEAILRDRGYQIITSQVDWDQPPPPGTVLAERGWNGVLEILLYPDPEQGTVGLTASARCLPER